MRLMCVCVCARVWVGGWVDDYRPHQVLFQYLRILSIQPNILLTWSYYSPVILETTTVETVSLPR